MKRFLDVSALLGQITPKREGRGILASRHTPFYI